MATLGIGALLTTIGSSVTAAGVATAATIAMSALSAIAQANASKSAARQAQAAEERKHKAALIQAKMDANSTNEKLLMDLSHNNAAAAASGLMSSGTVSNAQIENQKKANEETSIIRLNGEMGAANADVAGQIAANQGKAAVTSGYITAGSSLLNAFQTKVKTG